VDAGWRYTLRQAEYGGADGVLTEAVH